MFTFILGVARYIYYWDPVPMNLTILKCMESSSGRGELMPKPQTVLGFRVLSPSFTNTLQNQFFQTKCYIFKYLLEYIGDEEEM